MLTAILVRVEMTPQSFFSVTMASVWFINSFCAVLQGSLFGQLGSFPQSYSTLFLSGQGMAGTFAALAMLLSMASGLDSQTSALSYFVTPCVGTLISIVCYLLLPHKDFARHYLEKRTPEEPGCEMETKAGLLSPVDGPQGELLHQSNGNIVVLEQAGLKCPPEMMNGNGGANHGPPKPSVLGVLKKIWQLALCIVMVFSVTLSVFPAITASVASTSENKTWSEFFTPVCCFLLFNVMDWLGRSATSYFLWPEKFLRLLPAVVGLRLLLVPLLLLCNVPQRAYLPMLFRQDAWFVLFMVVFSLSNGYFVSLTMCLAPKQVQPQESELAGAIMTFFLALGLSCGAGLSFVLKALL
ncbi:equilibrative nucleoside transporter 2 isoform X2 [Elgaria multicarinata webbii]